MSLLRNKNIYWIISVLCLFMFLRNKSSLFKGPEYWLPDYSASGEAVNLTAVAAQQIATGSERGGAGVASGGLGDETDFSNLSALCQPASPLSTHLLYPTMRRALCPDSQPQFDALLRDRVHPEANKCSKQRGFTVPTPRSFFAPSPTVVSALRFATLLQPTGALCGSDTHMLVFTLSYHLNSEARAAIRNTWAAGWGANASVQVRQIFVFGRHADATLNAAIAREHAQHNDILQVDFAESYRNLSYKTHAAHRWFLQHCRHARYVLKTDDDVIINMPNLLRYLQGEPLSRGMVGFCNYGEPVHRFQSSKFYVPCAAFPYDRTPRYLNGPGYVLSGDLVPELTALAPYVPLHFIDDLYSTGLVPLALHNATLRCEVKFHSRKDKRNPVPLQERIVIDNVAAESMTRVWTQLSGES